MEKITVTLKEHSYPINIGSGLLNKPLLYMPVKAGQQAMIVTNHTLEILYLKQLYQILKKNGIKINQIVLPDGEQYKTLSTLEEILSELLKKSHNRDTTLIALGGGVIGDLTGFAASCYQRGVRFVQIPTTLLSQVDASVGGKTAINHSLGKNMIGSFYQPTSVIIDLNCLDTLSKREFSSGLAEVVKYGLALDCNFFVWLETNMKKLLEKNIDALAYCVRRCCELKAQIITIDEHENSLRSLLNLGHTFGHAIETFMSYGTWLHGEAISVGIVMASSISYEIGILSAYDLKRIKTLLLCANLPIYGPQEMTPISYFPYIMRDKKIFSGKLRLILPTSIGCADIRNDISCSIIKKSIAMNILIK
ncbi:3-dehydroquinate synthase [Candidatus Ecksteinia adelgidicola]|nr:3-dehydroquinate synthase [Candidatus Ecksteinia adelgidicola]